MARFNPPTAAEPSIVSLVNGYLVFAGTDMPPVKFKKVTLPTGKVSYQVEFYDAGAKKVANSDY